MRLPGYTSVLPMRPSSGAKTLVLESRGSLGGAATTEAPWKDAPHLRVTRLSYVVSLMPPTIVRELGLERHGYKVHPMGPYYQAFPEGGSLIIYEDDPKLASTLRGVLAQRLVRRLCPACRTSEPATDADRALLGPATTGRRLEHISS